MSEPHAGVVVRRVRTDEVERFKAFRLRALADAPTAFRTTLAEAEAMPHDLWEQRVTRGAIGEESVVLIAVDADTGLWLGVTGSFIEDDQPGIAHVVSVWVAPEARRRGVARALQDTARDWARSRGCREQRLWVTHTNVAARTLYQAAGFTPTGRTELHPGYPHLHEIEMAHTLDSP
jgi:ribosomal protein S18 acetylase RimI-like enzyme